jgi:two-component system phosphate regulon sensor histidine kinase PhoR
VLGALGLWFGAPIAWLLGGALAYIARLLFHLHRLQSWLQDSRHTPAPTFSGLLGRIALDVHRLNQGSRNRKKRFKKALERFQQSTAALPDATVIIGRQGEVEWWNPAAERLLGLRRPNDVGRRISNLVRHPAFVRRLDTRDWTEPLTLPSPVDDNAWITVMIVGATKGKRLFHARDSTRVHQLEQMRSDFVANVSHELRTPLTVMGGYVESLLELPQAHREPFNRALPQIHQQTRRMQGLVTDLLLLSHLELDQKRQRLEPIAIFPMLKQIREQAVELSGAGGHRIALDADARLGLVGNASELQSAFSNLVFNAVRYTPNGGDVRIAWFFDPQGAHFLVQDTGIGIDPHHIPRLTERFYRADVGRSRESGGTGLGLAIVKHVLHRHDGELSVTSDLGQGSTFICHFPHHHFVWVDPEPVPCEEETATVALE